MATEDNTLSPLDVDAYEAAAVTLRKVAAIGDLLVAAGENRGAVLSDTTLADLGLLLRDLTVAPVDRFYANGGGLPR